MVAGCGNKCVKYFFWLINFLFFILGAAILAFSVWMRIDPSMLARLASTAHIDLSRVPLDSIYVILYGIMAIGALLLILGFLGCCGSACESLCAIGLYFLFVIALFVIKIVAIVLYFVQQQNIRQWVPSALKTEVVTKYYTNPAMRDIMDTLQRSMQCCGGFGCDDYRNYGGPPPTCNCFSPIPPNGCGYVIWDAIQSNLIIVLAIVIVILVVELFAMVLSCIMCGAVKDKRNQTY